MATTNSSRQENQDDASWLPQMCGKVAKWSLSFADPSNENYRIFMERDLEVLYAREDARTWAEVRPRGNEVASSCISCSP